MKRQDPKQLAEAEMANMEEAFNVAPTVEKMRLIAMHMFYYGWDSGMKEGMNMAKDDLTVSQEIVEISEPIDEEESSFEEFWNMYDKKVNRGECRKAWAKLTKKERRDILVYVPMYKRCQPDKKFRKNPERFLRRKAWLDELIPTEYERYARKRRADEASILASQLGELDY